MSKPIPAIRADVVLLALLASLPSCGRAGDTDLDPASDEARVVARDSSAPIRTDAASYRLVWDDRGWSATIPFEFTNPAADTLYAVNCNGAIAVALERKEGTAWSTFWVPMMNACLSPPVVIPPGQLHRDTVELWGAPPGGNMGPEFRSADVEGTYRLIWTNLVSHYDDRAAGFGDTVPAAYRHSNDFQLEPGP